MNDPTAALRQRARQAWAASAPRERRLVLAATLLVAGALLWLLALQPALRSLREGPAQRAALEAQMQQMLLLAEEAQALQGRPALPAEQADIALRAATATLGPGAVLQMQGERAQVTLTQVDGEALLRWLGELRHAARARPVELRLQREGRRFSGSAVLALHGRP